jgi:tRNA-specific 2-thiouridylase
MSGGLDSSVVAHLLAAARRAGGRPLDAALGSLAAGAAEETPANGRCCGALDLGDARRVAQQIGIPHYTLRMDEDFRKHVVDPFVDDYLAVARPCRDALQTFVKFDLF